MASESDNKTEEPTGRRLEEAAKKGQVPYTKELGSTLGLVCILAVLYWSSQYVYAGMSNVFRGVLGNLTPWSSKSMPFSSAVYPYLYDVLVLLGFVFLTAFIAPLIGHIAQKGVQPRPEAAKPDMNKINPIEGAKKLFSMETFGQFVKNFLKAVGLIGIYFLVIRPRIGEIAYSAAQPYENALALYGNIVFLFLLYALIFMIAVIIMDYMFQRHQTRKKLMMSRQELKDEYKETEGNPEFKQKVKEVQIERSKRKIDQEVPGATVIVTNPTHFAVAIKYERGVSPVPIVVAKGADVLCQRIKEIAKESRVPIVENPPLARALYRDVKVGHPVPRSFFKAVAKILATIYRLEDEKKRQRVLAYQNYPELRQ